MQLYLKQPHLYSIHTVVSTHSKVYRGQTIKNDEDVLVTQLGKAEVETNCSNKGLIHTSHVTPTHVPVNHVDGESPKYLITYTYTSHIITIHALVTYLKHVLQSVIFVFMKNLRSLPNFVC